MNARHIARSAATALAAAVVLTVAVAAQTVSVPVRFSAVAVDMDRGVQTPIRITIQRWSSREVQNRLLDTLMQKGAGQLLDALRDAPKVGTIGTTTSLAWDLHYAQATPGEDGGTTIVVGTDRPTSFSEQWNQSRTLDYPFTIAELHVNKDGEGDGTLSFATKIIPDKEAKTIVLENWGTQRIRLQQVRAEKGTD